MMHIIELIILYIVFLIVFAIFGLIVLLFGNGKTFDENTKAELKQSRYNQFMLTILTSTIFFILGMIAYKYLALSGVVK